MGFQEMGTKPQGKNLMVLVETFDSEGEVVGTREVDMYHYGTRDWLSGHMWWATHNGHRVYIGPIAA